MKESIYIWDNLVWYKKILWSYIIFLDSDNNIIVDNISDLDIFDDDYYVKNKEWKFIKWKGILKLYKGDIENIYSLDESKIIFDKWYKYIKIPKMWYYKAIINYIVLDEEDKYYLSDIKGNIISKPYDNIDLWNSINNTTLTVSLGDEFNFISSDWKEISEMWFDKCLDFTYKEFTKVVKGESINYMNKQWKFLSSIWFDELIHLNEWYAIVKIDDRELIVWDYWEFEYEKKLFDNKYFQDKTVYEDYKKDKELIAFLVYIDYYMAKSYAWPHEWMKDFTLWLKNSEKVINILFFILSNYCLYKNKYSFLNEKEFENNYHDKLVWRREWIISSAIYYLIESDDYLKKKYNSNKYRNLSLTYMHYFITDLIHKYQDVYWWSKQDAENQILDVVYRENVYLFYWEWEWTPFCTWRYIDCIKK